MARQVLPIVGAVVGAFFGSPQIGYAIGAVIGAAVDPIVNQGPKIGETGAQTSQEGAPRAIIYGTASCTGNIIAAGPVIKSTEIEDVDGGKGSEKSENEHAYRNYAIRICEGPIDAILRIWEDDKLVYDVRPDSLMLEQSGKWIANKNVFYGDEDQLPSVFLNLNVPPLGEHPAHRGTAYIVFGLEDLTDRRGSIPQYRFEVAQKSGMAPWNFDFTRYEFTPVETTNARGIAVSPTGEMNITTNGSIFSSFDGKTWTEVPESSPGGSLIIYSDTLDRWTAPAGNFGTPYIHTKTGEAGWSSFVPEDDFPPQQNDGPYQSGVWAGDIFVAVGNAIRSPGYIEYIRSADGISWDFPAPAARGWSGLAYSESLDRLVAVNGSQAGYSDDHGSTWVDVATPGSELSQVVWAADLGLFVAVGGTPVWSEDGEVWTAGVWDGLEVASNAVAWSPERGLFVAPARTGGAPYFGVSEDGKNWSRRDAGVNFANVQSPQTAIWNSEIGRFVIASGNAVYLSNTAKQIGFPVPLSDIVSDIHIRCDVPANKYDVAELTDLVSGLVLAGDYAGADAINTLRTPYFFDKAEYSKKLHYPKRGAAVVTTLTIDDLVEEPDFSKREQAVEFAKKMHLFYQHAASGYAAVKATSLRSSPDARVVGETSLQVPVVLNEDQAAQTVSKLHKVSWAEAEGEVTISVPQNLMGLIPSDNVGLVLRGQVKRLRIEKIESDSGVIKLTLRHDRQSAYTSNLTGVPIPPPTLPPSTIVGATELAILDIPSRLDTEDDLHYLSAGIGALPAWYGYALQRSLDGGANYTTVGQYGPAVIGFLVEEVATASEYFTDTTNSVRVQLIRDGQNLQDFNDVQFLSEQGAFALEKDDGSWEVMQYRDSVQESSGVFALHVLHRGLLNSGASAHSVNARFVLLNRVEHIPAQSAWIGQDLTHRGVSLGDSPELAEVQASTYYGRSQIEWPVAYLTLTRDGSDNIIASWTPRHRFGTDDAPVASINFQGYRVTLSDGSSTATFDTLSAGFTYDASLMAEPVTVSVSALNRITGAGPSTSGAI